MCPPNSCLWCYNNGCSPFKKRENSIWTTSLGQSWPESRTCNPKVVGSSLRSGRNCRWGEWMTSALSTLNTTTEVRPLRKAPNPQLLPGRRSIGCPLLRVCVHGVCVFTAVCVHLDGLNAEHKFQIWVTILGHTSCHFTSLCVKVTAGAGWSEGCMGSTFFLINFLKVS